MQLCSKANARRMILVIVQGTHLPMQNDNDRERHAILFPDSDA